MAGVENEIRSLRICFLFVCVFISVRFTATTSYRISIVLGGKFIPTGDKPQCLLQLILVNGLKVISLNESQQLVEGLVGNFFGNDISCSIGLAGLELLKYIHQISVIYKPILVLNLVRAAGLFWLWLDLKVMCPPPSPYQQEVNSGYDKTIDGKL